MLEKSPKMVTESKMMTDPKVTKVDRLTIERS